MADDNDTTANSEEEASTVCRQRHLKCGEEKPRCENCTRGGRDCVYGVARSDIQPSKDTQHLSISDKENDISAVDDTDLQEVVTNVDEDLGVDSAIDDAQEQQNPDRSRVESANENTQEDTENPDAVGASYVYSPLSTLSSSASIGPETGPLRWFSIVATDFQNNQQASGTYTSIFDQPRSGSFTQNGSPVAGNLSLLANTTGGFNFASDPRFRQSPRAYTGELTPWSADVTLKDHEIPILEHFCTKIAEWQDVLDPMKHFASALPQLAMRNEGLMKAMLALSAKHMSLQPAPSGMTPVNSTAALQYYQDTLQYLHNAMKHPEYLKSIEVNATSLILSTYEMIDGMGRGWIRHLKGVFWIQRSQDTSADSGGLKAAIWWAWLRQDTWAALREKRKVLTIYKPVIPICDLDFWEHANFVSFLFALCVSYMSEEEVQLEGTRLQERTDRAKFLSSVLEEWFTYLPINFKAIPLVPPAFAKGGPFQPVWINPPSFGTVLQMYHAAKVILLAHAPAVGGFREFSSRNKQLSEAIDTVCGIAMTIKDGGSSLISTSCLWASGLCAQDDSRREAIAELIREHKKITGWPSIDLGDELRQEWAKWE